MSVLAYPGHAGGYEEAKCVANWIEQHAGVLHVEKFSDPNNVRSPVLWVMTKTPLACPADRFCFLGYLQRRELCATSFVTISQHATLCDLR